MNDLVRSVCLLLLLATGYGHGESVQESAQAGRSVLSSQSSGTKTTSRVLVSAASASRFSNSTCVSGTINYITNTLPQQCLRTDRSTTNATPSTVNATNIGGIAAGQTTGANSPEDGSPANSSATGVASSSGTANLTSFPPKLTGEASTGTVSSSSFAAGAVESGIASVETGEAELDPLLDSAAFLSFEEWKKQNLAKTGQSPESLGQEATQLGSRERPGINNALEGLGDDSEIDLDFSGFGRGAPSASSVSAEERSRSPPTAASAATGQSSAVSARLRNKDAGTTCKERNNYASFDCGANILKNNPECKHPSSVLIESKDSYMLNTCSASNKFFILQLCNDIHIDTIVLANYEFFSSNFRHFRVSVSDRYPVKMEKWKGLGTFEARNTREVQAFLVEEPQIWARYLRIEFLSHYGSEYYCPLSLLRVHGKTMMQEFRQEEELARGEVTDDDSVLESEVYAPAEAQEPLASTDEAAKATTQAISPVETSAASSSAIAKESPATEADSNSSAAAIATGTANRTVSSFAELLTASSDDLTCALPQTSVSTSVANSTPDTASYNATPVTQSVTNSSSIHRDEPPTISKSEMVSNATVPVGATSAKQADASHSFSTVTNATTKSGSLPTAVSEPAATSNATANMTSSTKNTSPVPAPPNASSSLTNSTRSSTGTVSPMPQPSSQESFFKSISKRLQQLESNSTLSLQYIEEQSRILREAFNKVEKRQISATTTFLSHLNETVMSELHDFRQAYDQLWQSTVIELDGQRSQYQREMLALSTRLTLVADELVWQKRMGIVQSTLLLLCLGLVLFARQGNGYYDMTLAQQLMNRSQAALKAGWESEPNSPSPVSRSPVSLFRRRIWRSSTEPTNGSGGDGEDSRPLSRDSGLEVEIEPPTPALDVEGSDSEGLEEEPGALIRPSSSPAVPNGDPVRSSKVSGSPDGSRPGTPLRFD